MKKLLFFAAATGLSALASCSNSGKGSQEPIEADTIYINQETVTPIDSDSVLVTDVQAQAVETNN
jgi:hypothetical protein